MSNGPDPARRLLRGLGGVGAGFVVLFGLVVVLTWLSMAAFGLSPEDPPTAGYLVLNLAGSALAALLAGMVAASVGRSLLPAAVIATILLIIGVAFGGQTEPGQPGWYPMAITLLGACGIMLGGFLAPGRAGEGNGSRLAAGTRAGPS